MRSKFPAIIFLAFLFSSHALPVSESVGITYSLSKTFSHKFRQPLAMSVYPEKIDGQTYYAVAEKQGVMYLVARAGEKQTGKKITLLDMRSEICSDGYEQGLLGMAFDPEYIKNRRMYIYYSRCKPSATYLARITVLSKLGNNVPVFATKAENFLKIDQPYANHNGGQIAFGKDGYLYIGTGDGGAGGDPHNYGQNMASLLGKILRLDVNTPEGYRIPADNPLGENGRTEIFAYGLRNPWRFSIDPETGWLWVGDVGQDLYEEISIVKKGGNYGWRIMEGLHCFRPSKDCPRKNLVMPVHEYSHNDGQSVIGGFVYHGLKLPELRGKYIFGDFVSGKIWYIDAVDKLQNKSTLLMDSGLQISSFAMDESGEIYVIDFESGNIFMLNR